MAFIEIVNYTLVYWLDLLHVDPSYDNEYRIKFQ